MRCKILVGVVIGMGLVGCGKSPPVVASGKATSHWLTASRDADAAVRAKAVEKLGNIGSKDGAALPAVFAALADPEATVRKQAIFAVVRNRRDSASALPVLSRMRTEDADPEIRQLADESYRNLTK